MQLAIVGVYPVASPEPCHLIEIAVSHCQTNLDICSITQAAEGQPRSNWQVPYDECFLDVAGKQSICPVRSDEQPDVDQFRLAFFFHDLDLTRPLQTPAGNLDLLSETPLPDRLAFMHYEVP